MPDNGLTHRVKEIVSRSSRLCRISTQTIIRIGRSNDRDNAAAASAASGYVTAQGVVSVVATHCPVSFIHLALVLCYATHLTVEMEKKTDAQTEQHVAVCSTHDCVKKWNAESVGYAKENKMFASEGPKSAKELNK